MKSFCLQGRDECIGLGAYTQLLHGPVVHGAATAESENNCEKEEQSNFHGTLS